MWAAPSLTVLFTFYPTAQLIQRPPVAILFCFAFFTNSDTASSRWSLRWPYLSLFEERYGRKTNQRASKPPFGIWLLYGGMRGDVRRSYEFAQVQFTRFRLVRWRAQVHCFHRTHAYCGAKVAVLPAVFHRTRSTQRRGNKRSAEADLIASIAPLRGGRHKARPA